MPPSLPTHLSFLTIPNSALCNKWRRRRRRRRRGTRRVAMLGGDDNRVLIPLCCSLSTSAHRSSPSPFLLHHHNAATCAAVFAFPTSWSADEWLLPGTSSPFGESEVDVSLFPSLKSVGNDTTAAVNGAFLRSFKKVLEASPLQAEVHKAVARKEQIVFTGHSSGGSIAVFAAIWFLEQRLKFKDMIQVDPLCVTFGSPLVGDDVFVHALQRENWARCFLHFVRGDDIIPRCLLAPLSSFKEEFQSILHFLSRPFCVSPDTIARSLITVHRNVLRNAISLANHQACVLMGCTNPLLQVLTGFIKLSPYRPFGTCIFHGSNGRLDRAEDSNAILYMLVYSFQMHHGEGAAEIAYRSLEEHLLYEARINEWLEVSSDAAPLKDLDLSLEGRLHLHAASEWETQRMRNQTKIDSNYSKIKEAINFLNDYRSTCEMRGLGYYDTFKFQKDPEDFNANVKRLELAGLWDQIIEMLRRYELPDGFEGRREWVKLGTEYRRLVEPLDIANYYRHSKNEDTGPYMVKGRPRRYRYTQRWLEHAEQMPAGSSSESSFWALVEELCIDSGDDKPFLEVRARVMELEEKVELWTANGDLSRDVFLGESTFVKWWMDLPEEHRLGSPIARFINGRRLDQWQ